MIRTWVRMFMVVILSLPFVACFANEDFEDLPNEPGRWSEIHLDSPNFNFPSQLVSRQELSMFQKNLQAVIDIVHASPSLNPLRGYDVQARMDLRIDDPDAGKPYWENLPNQNSDFTFMGINQNLRTKQVGRAVNDVHSIPVSINNPRLIFYQNDTEFQGEDGVGFHWEPKAISKVKGFILYENYCLLVPRQGIPFWLPVSQEMYLKARIRQLTKINNEMGPAAGDVFVKGINATKKALTDLSPQEKKAKAWVNGSAPPDETGMGGPDDQVSRSMVYVNPDYFRSNLARTEPQLIVIYLDMENNSFSDDCSENTAIALDERGICKVMQQLDLDAIQKLIR